MRRTRKWSFVAQEAKRLADVGLSPREIADRLEVSKSTVTRWIKAGKLTLSAASPVEKQEVAAQATRQSPEEWASSVRQDYALDATDDQLVTMAESALREALADKSGLNVRLQAMGRFQALVRQLNLVARVADQEQPAPAKPERTPLRVVPRRSGDPRRGLMTAHS